MKPSLFLMLSASAFAQIERPQIGVMLDAKGDARAVVGVAASATLSDPQLSGVLSLACSAQVCFAKTDTALLSSAGDPLDAPSGPSMIALDGTAAYVYFPETHQLVHWHDGQLEALDFNPGGEVLALRATGGGFEYAVRRPDGVWVEDQYLGDATAVLLLDGGGVLLASPDQVRLLRPDGSEVDFAVAGVQSFIRINDGCVQLVSSGGMWALRTDPSQEFLFQLPGVSQE